MSDIDSLPKANRVPLAILFADVVRSTALFERHGDETAREIIGVILENLTVVTHRFRGRVIKTIGDEIMSVFDSPSDGLDAACDMQRRITRFPYFQSYAIAVRIGIHHGEALNEGNDVYGDAVNVAARMAELSSAKQIITTAETIEAVLDDTRFHTRSLGTTRVKGKSQAIRILDVIWEEDTADLTLISSSFVPEGAEALKLRLSLKYQDQRVSMEEGGPPFFLGRAPKCDLVVNDEWVSRNHATIEFRKGVFLITDTSTNGTFVQIGSDPEFQIKRADTPLRGHGTISLGQPYGMNERHGVQFFTDRFDARKKRDGGL